MAKKLRQSPRSPQSLSQQQRRIKVLEYRIQHASLRRIADKLGVSHQTIKNDLDKAMEDLHKQENQRTRDYQMMELQRLELASTSIIKRVLEGDVEAIGEYRRLSESRRKLLGLDMPTSLKVDATMDAEINTSVNTEIGEETLRFIQELRGDS